MRKKTYSESEIREAIKNNRSVRQVCFEIKLKQAGGNHESIKKFIKSNNVDISHFYKTTWNKGRVFGYFKKRGVILADGGFKSPLLYSR